MNSLGFLTSSLRCISILVLLAGILILQGLRLNDNTSNDNRSLSLPKIEAKEKALQLKLKFLKKIPSIGYKNLISSLIYLDFLQYFGNHRARQNTGYTASPLFFQGIIVHDPRYTHNYLFLSASVSLYTAQPDISVSLMEQGLKFMTPRIPPDSYYVWRYKATDELLFIGDSKAAQKSHLKAAEWAEKSPDPESDFVGNRSRETAHFLAQDVNSKPAQISSWAQILAGAIDDQTRKLAAQRIEELGGLIIMNEHGQVTVQYKLDDQVTE